MQCGQHWIFWVTRLPSILLDREHTRNRFNHWRCIRETFFIAGWAYEETMSSLADDARKCLKVEYLSRIEHFVQSLVSQALETIRIRFLKKYFENFMLLYPLMNRFLYAVRPTLNILGNSIAILLDKEHTRIFHCWLSIPMTYFIAGWAEMFKSQKPQPNQTRRSKILCHRPLRP